MMNIAMIVLIFVIFYFFMIRPQQRKQKELQKKREALGTNDRIVTSGGLYGVIKDIKETEFVVEIADGVRVRVDKGSVFPAGDSSARYALPREEQILPREGCPRSVPRSEGSPAVCPLVGSLGLPWP